MNLKEKYITYQAQQSSFIKNEEFSVTKETIVYWVLEIWKNEKFITKEIINKVFKKAGISNKLDGSEDDLFVYPEEL